MLLNSPHFKAYGSAVRKPELNQFFFLLKLLSSYTAFVILTALFLLAATHQSGMLCAFLVSLELFFILQMADFFKNGANPQGLMLSKAAGAFAILSGILAFYLALASLLTKDSAFFTLPTFDFKSDE